MAYSHDLRLNALEYSEKGASKEDASRIFGITLSTLFNWIKRKKQGCLAPNQRRKRKPHKIDREKFKAYIEEHPESDVREIAPFFGTTLTAVFYAGKRLKMTLKKRHPSTKKEMKRRGKNFKRH